MRKKFLMLFPLILSSLLSFGQFFYKSHSIVDSVEISYKWKEVKDGPKELRLKFKNKNVHPVLIDLSVDYYMTGVLEESSPLENFCVNGRSMVAGTLDGVIITSSNLSNKQLNSDDFKFEINDISVERVDQRCMRRNAEEVEE